VTGAVALLVVLLAVVGPLVLYALVRSEHDDRERMRRDRAERAARRDRDTDVDSPERGRDDRRRNA
jgi:hypothetical protein